jgi:superfamily II DNA or RNA helicase
MQKFDPREFGLVIVDESHHITARSYRRAVKHYANAKILGVTATPDRADEEALGQIFDSVAFTYDIPDGINDGWLVPIDQRLVRVEDLDFSQCRTTAGDLNQGDLEHALLPAMDIDRDEPGLSTEDREKIQKEERLLHGMVGPTIELAGDMPTLIFAASVSHAERVAEIINRHHEGSAVCLHGKTPADERRTQLQRFANGEFQYLVNVGLFLEGWDQPKVACVAVYRATKSRSLYAQILGRALRPLPGIVDGEDTDADTRKEAISMSGKNSALILDFCGNSGKHKLVTAADLLGGHYSDEVVQLAKAAIIKKNTGGKSADALLELRTAQKQIEERERQKRREIMARARFDTQVVSPFDIFDLPVGREPGWFKGKRPSQRMIEVLQKSGIETAELTFWEAKRLIGRMAERRDQGMCTFRQAKLLARHGYNTNMTFEEAKRTIDQIAKDNNWAQRSQK